MKKGRVIGGYLKSRIIQLPESKSIRPTSDSIKQRIFDILNNWVYITWKDVIFLDLFAGSGAVGIEAISRGVKEAVFFDQDQVAINCILANLNNLNISAKVIKSKIEYISSFQLFDFCRSYKTAVFFLDPPYKNTKLLIDQISRISQVFQNSFQEVFIIVETDSDLNFENLIHKFEKGEKRVFFLKLP